MIKEIRKTVFPVAGFGTRFLPATKAVPKELLPIVDGLPVIVLASSGELNEKTQSNAAEVAARGARWINVGCEVAAADQLALPEAPDIVVPFLQALAVQMIPILLHWLRARMWISQRIWQSR